MNLQNSSKNLWAYMKNLARRNFPETQKDFSLMFVHVAAGFGVLLETSPSESLFSRRLLFICVSALVFVSLITIKRYNRIK